MQKLTFGTPEELTPSKFCPKFSYQSRVLQDALISILGISGKY